MKNNVFLFLSFLVCLLFSFDLLAQNVNTDKENYVKGEIIVLLHDETNVEKFCKENNSYNNLLIEMKPVRRLAQTINLWLLKYDSNDIYEKGFLENVRKKPSVKIAQFNHTDIKQRDTTPNDTRFNEMWNLDNTGQTGGTTDADVDAPAAWDYTTGGLTAAGDEIVVAVIDNGCQLDHPDLAANIWLNDEEIPGNGIDDDLNGYVDDVNGWNAYNNNGTIPAGSHGTHVCGTIGAVGNNNLGVTGINWDVSLMPIAGSSGVESVVLAAYGYALDMRTVYNNTGGAEGAFVVSTNSSFGVDLGDPADFPLWCEMYNTMGEQGILSACATANASWDIDDVLDVPTACASDYVIAVTNTDHNDNKNTSAGFGATTIDIGAPGTDVLSTVPGDNYDAFTGTSMATPHIAGAVALILAGACENFIEDYKNDPGTVALQIKDIIMNGADPNTSLDGITVSGGRLNLNNSLEEITALCGPTYCTSIGTSVAFEWIEGVVINGQSNYSGNDGGYADYTNINTGNVSAGSSCTVSLEPGYPGTVYNENFKVWVDFNNDGDWDDAGEEVIDYPAATGLVDLSFLVPLNTPAGSYNCRVSMAWGDTPLPCGDFVFGEVEDYIINVIDAPVYCDASSSIANEEWIQSVTINDFTNNSGSNGGYADFTSLNTGSFLPGSQVDITIDPEYAGIVYEEYFKVWVDFNQDGILTDPGEEVVSYGPVSTTDTSTFTIPTNILPGAYHCRVIMQWGSAPVSCGNFSFGEVEDYIINVEAIQVNREIDVNIEDTKRNNAERLSQSNAKFEYMAYPNPFNDIVNITFEIESPSYVSLQIKDATGREVSNLISNTKFDTGNHNIQFDGSDLSAGLYFYVLQVGYETTTNKLVLEK